MTQRLKGFTLIELIVVIGIIAILAGITIVAVNPSRQFAAARNTQRSSDILAILNAVHQHAADNNGVISTDVPTASAGNVCASSTESSCAAGTAPLYTELVTGGYLTAIPKDPGGKSAAAAPAGTDANTQYTIQNLSGKVTVCAPNGATTTQEYVAMKSNCVSR